MTYKDKLKDIKWINRRNDILMKDGFKCVRCGKDYLNGGVFNIHHLIYYKDREPWQYDDKELITLCENCHKFVHNKSGL